MFELDLRRERSRTDNSRYNSGLLLVHLPALGASGWKTSLVLQEPLQHFHNAFSMDVYLRVDLLQLLHRQAALVDVVFVFLVCF